MAPADVSGGPDAGEDLFDRWLAHRAQAPARVPEQAPDQVPVIAEAPPSAAVAPPVPEPTSAPVDSPADADTEGAPLDSPTAVTRGTAAAPRDDVPEAATEAVPGATRPAGHRSPDRGRTRRARRPRRPAPARDHERDAILAALRPEADPRRHPRATPPAPEDDGGIPLHLDFTVRRGVQRTINIVLMLTLAATGAAAYVAYADRTETTIATATALGALTVFVWAVRASTSPTRISLTGGRLEIHRNGGRHLFDLTNPALPVEEIGSPGDRRWRVHFVRRGMDPFVVDSSMVDPHEFSRALDHYRPRRS